MTSLFSKCLVLLMLRLLNRGLVGAEIQGHVLQGDDCSQYVVSFR